MIYSSRQCMENKKKEWNVSAKNEWHILSAEWIVLVAKTYLLNIKEPLLGNKKRLLAFLLW